MDKAEAQAMCELLHRIGFLVLSVDLDRETLTIRPLPTKT